MLLKFLVDEDYVNYKKCSMFIGFPYCTFKCDKENHNQYCHNYYLSKIDVIEYSVDKIVNRYLLNDLSKSIVIGGLEPMENFNDLISLIKKFREFTEDTIVIYTGFYKNEIEDKIKELQNYKNIIVKFGRFKPNQQSHYDEVLGVELANDEQYAEQIS